MIGVNHGRQHPRNLRQISGRYIRQKIDGKLRPEGVLIQRRRGILKILEVRQNIVRQERR